MERDDESDAAMNLTSDGYMEFDTTPGLAFMKLLSASIDGQAVPRPHWSSILLAMIGQLKAKGLNGEKLIR